MTAFCRHPGCLRDLSPGNVSGVCKAHMHGAACRCATCAARQRPRALPVVDTTAPTFPGLNATPPQMKEGTR